MLALLMIYYDFLLLFFFIEIYIYIYIYIYMANLLIEALWVGLAITLIGAVVGYGVGYFMRVFLPTTKLPVVCKRWNRYHVMEISLFLTGFLGHLLFEMAGLNRWYCKYGRACRR